jgi:hypothetical protein
MSKLSEEELVRLRKEEIEWRKSPETLELFREAEKSGMIEWIDIVEKYQEELIIKNGYGDEELYELRTAHKIYKENPVLTEESFWVKFNRFSYEKDYLLNDGDELIDCDLYDEEDNKYILSELAHDKITIIVTGSYT